MAEEIFDICNEQDEVVGQLPRSEVHRLHLLHRAVHIWVWNSSGQLLIHRRSASKDEYPGCFTSSASGHLEAGEDYAGAAGRELMEELGLSGSLQYEARLPGSSRTSFEHTVLYSLQTDVAPRPDPGEIAELIWRWPADLVAEVREHPERFTPPFCELMLLWDSQRA
jgi:16S rRNA (adenine1518-N6/adenine1519-N6)-dimethyltransferase